MIRLSLLFVALCIFAACTTTNAIRYGNAPQDLPRRSADGVRVYRDTADIACDYEAIGRVQAAGTVKGMEGAVTEEAKEKAAEMGANAVLVGAVANEGASLRDYAGNTRGVFEALFEHRPCG